MNLLNLCDDILELVVGEVTMIRQRKNIQKINEDIITLNTHDIHPYGHEGAYGYNLRHDQTFGWDDLKNKLFKKVFIPDAKYYRQGFGIPNDEREHTVFRHSGYARGYSEIILEIGDWRDEMVRYHREMLKMNESSSDSDSDEDDY